MPVCKKIILSSQSKIRKKILKNSGLTFSSVKPDISEDSLKNKLKSQDLEIEEIIKKLAILKSESLFKRPEITGQNETYSIGCDQGLIFERKLYDKVKNYDQAYSRLRQLSGKTHSLFGVTSVSYKGKCIWYHKAISSLKMHDFSDVFIKDYLNEEGEAVLDTVGCYRLEGKGIQLFEKIEGDYFSILGLSLLPLLTFFRKEGVIKP